MSARASMMLEVGRRSRGTRCLSLAGENLVPELASKLSPVPLSAVLTLSSGRVSRLLE